MVVQRKKASENGGTDPASPRARIILETCAMATRTNPVRASALAQRSPEGFEPVGAVCFSGDIGWEVPART
jgi:hypothetical protein